MPFQENDFRALFERLRAIDLFGAAPPDVPYPLPPQEAAVRQAIQSGELKLPVAFQQAYSEPLLARLKTVMARLADSPDIVETLAGGVYQHVDPSVAGDLGRFLAVISDLYRSFLSKKRRIQADFPLVETLPPLAMFQHSGDAGPFTIPCDDVQQLADATVGVVSLPATYRNHPLLWASLGHETGGHDVLHADRELLPELEVGVESFFGSGQGRTSGRISDERLMGAIWSYWIDEAASDVYGALNIGPAFGHNLVAFFAALNAQAGDAHDGPSLRTVSGFDPRDPAQALDPHPTDILRPFVLIGAVQSLRSLSEPSRSAYVEDLQRLAAICAPQARTVRLAGIIRLGPGRNIPVDRSFPIEAMQLAAVQVGAFIANARLNALNGHSIQEIETWDDADEAAAQRIATGLLAGTPVAGLGDDAQLMAGATLAAFHQPSAYDGITRLLGAALDVSFANDPLWGAPRHESVILRAASTRMASTFLTAVRPQPTVELCRQVVVGSTDFPLAFNGDEEQQLHELGVADDSRARAHQLRVSLDMHNRGFRIDADDVKSGPAITVGDSTDSVKDNAK